MKILLTIIGLINATYMLIDGVYVIVNGKYIGPEKPGPWSDIFSRLNIDVFKLGPMFITFGLLWLQLIYALQTSQSWTYWYGIILSIATLWYLPFGTLIAVLTIALFIFFRNRIGI